MNALDPTRWAVLGPQIDALLDLTPTRRIERLRALACDDPTTARELGALLEAHADVGDAAFLDTPASAAMQPHTVAAGDSVGAWTLVEPIGEGGMGSVWRARRSDGRFDGEAAVKLLKSGLFDAHARQRFSREGAILSRLRHPGIAQLFDAGVTAQGQPFLVLELVHGEPIDAWCGARALGVRERIELFLHVLDAVAFAHGRLVIHRDLKPSNILVESGARVKLLDFGIARLVDEADDAGAPTALTRDGQFVLTPSHAAPEQFERGTLSTATDVYALGIVLHQLLTGTHPSGLPAGSSALAYARAATDGGRQAASTRAPTRRHELRGDLDNILAKSLMAEPTARYPSAMALADDLRRHLAHEPVLVRPATAWYRMTKLAQRRPFESLAAAAVLVAIPAGAHLQAAVLVSLGVGTGVALWQWRRARVQAAVARHAQHRAEAANEFVGFLLSQSEGRKFTTSDLLERADTLLDRGFAADASTRASLRLQIGHHWAEIDNFVRAQRSLDAARQDSLRAGDAVESAVIEATVGQLLVVTGRVTEGRAQLIRAVGALRRAGPGARHALARALKQLADVELSSLGDPWAAMAHAQEAIELVDDKADRGCTIAQALHVQASALSHLGCTTKAVCAFEQALDLANAAGRGRSVMVRGLLNSLGVLYARAGQTQRARTAYEEVIEIERGLWPEEGSAGVGSTNLAKLLAETGHVEEAARVLVEQMRAAEHKGDRRAMAHVALQATFALTASGETAQAQALLTEASTGMVALHAPDHFIFGSVAFAAAKLAAARGAALEAERHLRRARAIFVAAKERTPTEIRLLAALVDVELARGDLKAARELVHDLDERATLFTGDFAQSTWTGIAALTAAKLARAEHREQDARRSLAKADEHLGASLGDAAPETIEARRLAAA